MKSSTDTLLEVVSRKLDVVKEDQHDIFAKNVAEKLRHLDPTMRIISEKLINEVLFEAQMGSLNRRAYIYIPPFDNNYSNRESYQRQPPYQQLVQIRENSSISNEPSYPPMQSSDSNDSVAQYFSSYQANRNM